MKRSTIIRLAFMLLLYLPFFGLFAQNNLREGYVITLQGDTLHGDLDFRTSAINSKQCVFRKDGTASFVTYQPGEIKGYRYLNNGIYYVSKQVINEADSSMTVFAEYIIRGNLNLYQVGDEEMLIEDENGNHASYSCTKAQRATKVKDRQNEMKGVLSMLSKSSKATNLIWSRTKSRENTKEAVKTYIDDVCVNGQCEVFEYKEKNIPKEDRILHPWVKAGFKTTIYNFWGDDNTTAYAPQFSAGLDFHLNRLFNGLMASVALSYENVSSSREESDLFQGFHDGKNNGTTTAKTFDFSQLDIMLGPGYQCKAGPVMAHVKAGVIYRLVAGDFDCTYCAYYYRGGDYVNLSYYEDVKKLEFDTQFGMYASCGVEYPLKKCSIICDLDYIYDYNQWSKSQILKPEKTTVKQHGFCLSAGVKF